MSCKGWGLPLTIHINKLQEKRDTHADGHIYPKRKKKQNFFCHFFTLFFLRPIPPPSAGAGCSNTFRPLSHTVDRFHTVVQFGPPQQRLRLRRSKAVCFVVTLPPSAPPPYTTSLRLYFSVDCIVPHSAVCGTLSETTLSNQNNGEERADQRG